MINPLVYFLLFLKASLFSTGGFSNLPSLHQDLIGYGWATEADFGQSIAIGQISPGPNGLWVISMGYLTNGFLGASLALIARSIPAVLTCGDHAKVAAWRRAKAERLTRARRPDLWAAHVAGAAKPKKPRKRRSKKPRRDG